jgi:SAM-dependent methyltransferase
MLHRRDPVGSPSAGCIISQECNFHPSHALHSWRIAWSCQVRLRAHLRSFGSNLHCEATLSTTPLSFETAYKSLPPWDIGHPQSALIELADHARGSILDVGCGTGEHALFYASRGHDVWGIDGVAIAIERARSKAQERGLKATFVVGDALGLAELHRTFDTVVDSGLFHVFDDAGRLRYVSNLGRVLMKGGVLHLLCFSERTPGTFGPRRVTQAEIHAAFSEGWTVREIVPATFETRTDPQPMAWRALVERTA